MKTKLHLLTILHITAIIVCLSLCIRDSFIDLDNWYGPFNSNARIIFQDTDLIIYKYNIKYNKDFPDGIYSGSLQDHKHNLTYEQSMKQLENTEFTDHYDFLHTHLFYYIGGKSRSGYYCTVIMDNTPVASYWSKSSVAAEYSEQLGIIAQTDADDFGMIKGFRFGSYPKENRGSYKDEISLDHTGNKLELYSDPRIKPKKNGIYDDYTGTQFDSARFIMVVESTHKGHILIILIILLILRIAAVLKKKEVIISE